MLSFVVLPLTARLLGMDAFGLLGIAATFQLIVFVMDGCNVITRLMAREIDSGKLDAKMRASSLFLAAERRYIYLLGLGLSASLALDMPLSMTFVAHSSLSSAVIGHALALIGLGTFVKLIASYYRGALIGLHAQVPANMIGLAANIVRFPVAYAISWLAPDIRVFLAIQLLSFLSEALVLRTAFKTRLDFKGRASLEPGRHCLHDERRFLASTLGLAAITTLANQVDKVMLASALTLRAFGAASLAILLCAGLFVLATPIHQIFLPRLASRLGVDQQAAKQTIAAMMATLLCVTLPAALTLAFCAPMIARLVAPSQSESLGLISDAFLLWGTGNCLAIVALGLYLVYFAAGQVARYAALLLAYLAVYLPLSWWAVNTHGLHGAGAAWVAGNLLLLALLSVDLARRQVIDHGVLKMLVGSAACLGMAWGLSSIIRPVMPSGAWTAACLTVLTFCSFLSMAVLVLLPTLRRASPP